MIVLGAEKSMVWKWNGKARLFAPYNRILLWEVPCTDRHFLLFFLWGCKGFVHFLCRPSILSLPRASLICNCEPYPHLKLWCAQTWWNWCGSKKVLKCRNKSFATEVLFKCCRIYSLSSRMRDVKAVYPTPSKAYFRVSDNQSNCIFTCKAHQSSTLSKKIFRLRCQYKFYDCHSLLIAYPTFSESATFCLECKQVLRIESYAYNASSCLEYNHMPRMQADA